jgi:hypothetical protein
MGGCRCKFTTSFAFGTSVWEEGAYDHAVAFLTYLPACVQVTIRDPEGRYQRRVNPEAQLRCSRHQAWPSGPVRLPGAFYELWTCRRLRSSTTLGTFRAVSAKTTFKPSLPSAGTMKHLVLSHNGTLIALLTAVGDNIDKSI